MKKILFLSVALLVLTVSFATSNVTPKPRLKASEIFIPIGNSGKTISLQDLSELSIKDAQVISGKKMKFFDRLGFKAAQRKLKNSINPDGTINSKKITKYLKGADGSEGFHIGGFALGFFVGLIGVLIAYLIKDDYKSNRVKWAWIGWGVFVVLYLALLLAVL